MSTSGTGSTRRVHASVTQGGAKAGSGIDIGVVFNMGMSEIVVILVVALVFLGPKKLPELASGLGKMIRELRKATADIKNEIELDDAIRKPVEELREAMTLHPEELKRRDAERAARLQREREEKEQQEKEAHQRAVEAKKEAQAAKQKEAEAAREAELARQREAEAFKAVAQGSPLLAQANPPSSPNGDATIVAPHRTSGSGTVTAPQSRSGSGAVSAPHSSSGSGAVSAPQSTSPSGRVPAPPPRRITSPGTPAVAPGDMDKTIASPPPAFGKTLDGRGPDGRATASGIVSPSAPSGTPLSVPRVPGTVARPTLIGIQPPAPSGARPPPTPPGGNSSRLPAPPSGGRAVPPAPKKE